MAITPFSLPSPQAISPYPIEGELANKIEGQYALPLLNMYRSNRNIAQQGYEDEVQAQHQYAYDQLARQMAAEKLKGFTDIAKLPGGVDFARSSGTGLDLGADPEALARFAGATNLAQSSENFQKAGAGWGSLAHAGAQVPFGLVPGLERYAGTPIGETDLVQAARIRAAASGGGGTKEDKIHVSSGFPDTAEGLPQSGSMTVPVSRAAQADAALTAEAARRQAARSDGTGPNRVPSLPPAQTEGSGKTTSTPPGPQRLDTNSPAGKAAQTQAMKLTDRLSKSSDATAKAVAADLQKGMTGTTFTITKLPNGKTAVTGGSGKQYDLGL